jgi:PTS system fructose-specific IIA component/PTS system nitrogen regulatory IIA component
MVQSLVDAGGIQQEDYEAIIKAFIEREELASTGIGRGVAVPYTRHSSTKQPISAVAISTEGVDFDSLDDEIVHLFVMTLSPTDSPGSECRVMEHLERRLKDDTLCRLLKQAKTREAIFALLEEADRNQ